MSKVENYSFKSSDDEQTTIHAVKWSPDEGKPVAVLQLVHGMIEYIERYDEFARFLADRGFIVMGHDHIGHGDSVKSESDWGVFHTKNPDVTLVEDMFTNYQIIKEQYPDIPYFILGHSMGSYLLREFLSMKAGELQDVNGAIIMGTGTVPDKTLKAALAIANIISVFHGPDYKSKFLANLSSGGASYKAYDCTGKDPEKSWLSKNVESVTKYYKDPKDTFLFSVNGWKILYNSCRYDNNMENVKKMNMEIPVLFVSGSEDPVGDLGEGVKLAYKSFLDAGVKDCTMHLYENDRHELLQETDREKIYSDLYDFMKERMR